MMLTEALVLKTWPYSETTLIASLLTPEQGVVRVLAKGVRRIRGGAGASFDLFSVVRAKVRTRSGHGLGSIGSVELRRAWSFLRSDLKRLALASVGIEILGALAETSAPEPVFFEQAIEFLSRLEDGQPPGSLTAALLLGLLHFSGHGPRLAEGLAPDALPERLDYDFSEGAVVERLAIAARGRMPLARPLVESLLPALREAPTLQGELVITGEHGRGAMRWLVRVWEDHLGRKIHAAQFMEKTLFADR